MRLEWNVVGLGEDVFEGERRFHGVACVTAVDEVSEAGHLRRASGMGTSW